MLLYNSFIQFVELLFVELIHFMHDCCTGANSEIAGEIEIGVLFNRRQISKKLYLNFTSYQRFR